MRFSTYALASSVSLTTASIDCCGDLHSALSSKVVFPDTSAYNASEASYFAAAEATLRPSCVFYPTASEDVSIAVKILAKNRKCNFAIKGGGHNPNSGYANVQDGVTINFSNMAAVEVDGSVVKVGAGARWLSVYKALEPLGLAVAGGRNGNVGVGGLLLGGGISHFTTRVGWACDNVVNYEVVLPSGRIVQANAKTNTDLFHALCGGGNNFGLVTRFDLKAFQQGDISVTTLVNDISHRKEVFDAFSNIVTSSPFDPDTSLVTSLIFNSTSKAWTLSNSAVYAKPEQKPEVFQELSAVPNIVNSTAITSLASFADEKPITSANVAFATLTFKASSAFMEELFDTLNSTLHSVDVPGVLWIAALEPLAGRMLTTGKTLGMQQNKEGYVVLLSPIWSDPSSAGAVNRLTNEFVNCVEQSARKQGLFQPFQYANYAAADQKPLESYGHAQLERLRETSRKYDPLQVMQQQVKGYKICNQSNL